MYKSKKNSKKILKENLDAKNNIKAGYWYLIKIILKNHLFEESKFKENYKRREKKNAKIGRLIMLEV
jgi:hypothetical protein